ncbi:MAG: hypothetical protein AB1801_14155 [Chloroflexota bacterium]
MHLIPLFMVLAILVGLVFILLAIIFIKGLTRKLARTLQASSLPISIARSLRESRYYGKLIIQTVQGYPPGPIRDRLNLTIQPVDKWLANLTRLEQGLAKLYSQRNLFRELRQTGNEIEYLRRQLLTARGQEAAGLQALKQSKEQHLAALQELQVFQTGAELKIRKIASDLGATHAEMLLIIARGDFNENRLRRLDANLQEHLSGMRDIITAMDEMGYSHISS